MARPFKRQAAKPFVRTVALAIVLVGLGLVACTPRGRAPHGAEAAAEIGPEVGAEIDTGIDTGAGSEIEPAGRAGDAATALASPPAAGWIDIAELDPSIRLDLRYATSDNVARRPLYPVARCLLRRDVAERLVRVQAWLRERGMGLLLFDCYRPFSVQETLWELVPDGRYVARPVSRRGVPVRGSRHNRGAAVDLTLVDAAGKELVMPTEFDDFSERASADHPSHSKVARANAALLRRAMKAQGFSAIASEWWHFDGPGWQDYPIADLPLSLSQKARLSTEPGTGTSPR